MRTRQPFGFLWAQIRVRKAPLLFHPERQRLPGKIILQLASRLSLSSRAAVVADMDPAPNARDKGSVLILSVSKEGTQIREGSWPYFELF